MQNIVSVGSRNHSGKREKKRLHRKGFSRDKRYCVTAEFSCY